MQANEVNATPLRSSKEVEDSGKVFPPTGDDFIRAAISNNSISKSGAEYPFPVKLHFLLCELEKADQQGQLISWLPGGMSFKIHNRNEAFQKILARWFRMTKFSSFQRQLNMYNFTRRRFGVEQGAYYHELFLRDEPTLCFGMVRFPVKETRFVTRKRLGTQQTTQKQPYVASSYQLKKEYSAWKKEIKHDSDKRSTTTTYSWKGSEPNSHKLRGNGLLGTLCCEKPRVLMDCKDDIKEYTVLFCPSVMKPLNSPPLLIAGEEIEAEIIRTFCPTELWLDARRPIYH